MLSEDNVNGKISDARFSKMSGRYELEQGEIATRVGVLRKELKKGNCQIHTADSFLDVVRRYTDAQELTQRMLSELIDHIDIFHAEKAGLETTQEITIHYNCIGPFDVPDSSNIPDIDILMETRKGVAIGYTTTQKAG